ncbi:long-chain-fatty-acid--CoA ligase [Kallotenue papyrolyticum]|uniref:long-chain-fatty-acid--CoA ligase n=1 Tax=Kallotenue papyrolyticum TaxID=1325125 RepID=UPI00047858AD|nr:long-chain fatty acid--CoA ligase [Kallotenue papyrolyticum]
MLNLSMIVEDHARKRPSREAVVFGETRLTYGQVNAMANQIANALVARGIQPGDKVALSCPNLPFFPIVYYGILKAGAVVVPLNVLLKTREIAYHLRDSDAKAYFCFEGTPDLPMGQMGWEAFQQVESCAHFVLMTANPAAPSPIEGATTLGMLLHGQPPTFQTVLRSPEDTAVILYTSGTTGQPKGAELTHNNMLLNAIVSRDLHAIDPERERNVILIALPLFHSFGQTCQMNAGFYHGATLVLVPRFDPGVVLDLMRREQVNFFSGVPTMFWALLHHARQHNVDTAAIAAHLQLCSSGGASLPVEVLRGFEETFGVQILEGYGLSETSPVATFNHRDLPRKVGSIGIPIFGVEVRVVDDQDHDVPVNQPGEIVIRGHNVMKGYYKRPEATAEAMRGGWFHTGDIARMDEDGYLFILDRKKDMILRGGFNVYPREVEEVMMTHPAVSMVAVVGIPDEVHGEEIKAYVIKKPGAEISEAELIEWCKQNMASYKYPRIIEFREQLPMSATGKILKRELRAQEQPA